MASQDESIVKKDTIFDLETIAFFLMATLGFYLFFFHDFKSSSYVPSTEKCFKHEGGRAYVPLYRPFNNAHNIVKRKYSFRQQHLNKVLRAIEACPLEDCTSTALYKYKRALHFYIQRRAEETYQFDYQYGERGLAVIQKEFSKYPDRLIVDDLKRRINNKQVNWHKMMDRDFVRVLLQQEPETIRPCRGEVIDWENYK